MADMGRVSKITLKSAISDDEMENFDQMLDESLSTAVGEAEYDNSCGESDKIENNDSVQTNIMKNDDELNLFPNSGNSQQKSDSADIEQKSFGSKTLEEKMNDIHNEFLGDVTITIANIKDIAFREAAIKGRWCSRLMAERVRKRRLVQTLNTLMEELNEIANSKTVQNGSYLAGRRSVKDAIDSNPEVIALRKEISESNEIEKYLTDLNECIRGLGYTVKNSLDVLNLERGI